MHSNDFNSSIPESSHGKILIADDNSFTRMILGNILEQQNVSYDTACTGRELINKVKECDAINKAYRLLVVDIMMPELDGLEATRKLVELYNNGEIKSLPAIIGYTSMATERDIAHYLEFGMKEVLIKPCSSQLLTQTMMKYLRN